MTAPRTPHLRLRARGPARSRDRRGMTLVELMVALFVLGTALLALAGFSATVTRQLDGGKRQSLAATMAQSRLDSLSTLAPCNNILAGAAVRTGTRTMHGVRESWVIRDGNDVIHVTDTVTFRGRANPLVYHSILVCRD